MKTLDKIAAFTLVVIYVLALTVPAIAEAIINALPLLKD